MQNDWEQIHLFRKTKQNSPGVTAASVYHPQGKENFWGKGGNIKPELFVLENSFFLSFTKKKQPNDN